MIKIRSLFLNKYSSNLLWTFFEKILGILNSLIVVLLLARYLGPTEFGVLTYSQSYVALFGFIISLGLNSIVVKEIVNRSSISEIIVSTAFILQLLMFVFVFVFINVLRHFTNDSKDINLIIFIISIGLLQYPFYSIVNYFQAIVNIKYISLMIICSKIILIAFKIAMIYLKVSLIYFVILDSIVFLLLSLSYFLYYSSSLNLKFKNLFRFNKKIAFSMLNSSWPLLLSSGAIVIYMRLDQIMIKEMLSLKELGNYAVCVKVSESWYFIPIIITTVLFPYVIEAKAITEDLYLKRLNNLFFTTIWIAIFIALFFIFFSEDILIMLMGNEFKVDNYVLLFLALSGIFVSMGYVNGKWIIIENFTKIELIRNVSGALINALLNFILIPIYGIKGAAFSTLIAIFIASNLIFIFYSKTRKMFYMQNTAIFNFKIFK